MAGPGARTAPHRRRALSILAAGLVASLVLPACTSDDSPSDAARPAPTLEPLWRMSGLGANPEASGENHWFVAQGWTSGQGRQTSTVTGPLMVVDAHSGATGRRDREPGTGRGICATPRFLSAAGVTPVLWATYRADPYSGSARVGPCNRLTVIAASGELLWRDNELDLADLEEPYLVGALEEVVAVADDAGRGRCFDTQRGTPVARDDDACTRAVARLSGSDLPRLTDPDGNTVELSRDPYDSQSPHEVGRFADVLVVEIHPPDASPIVRAHDLNSGETLWERDDLAVDPVDTDAWVRRERYVAGSSGVLHVTYDHPDYLSDGDAVHRTPMLLTAVDSRTGKDRDPVGMVEGALFMRQVGDVTVALTQQERQFHSTISGYDTIVHDTPE